MAIYKYKALNAKGKLVSGVQEAETDKHARQELRNINLIVTHLERVKVDINKKRLLQNYINSKDLAIYIKQLSVMISSGLPIESALSVIVKQSKKKKDRIIWTSIRSSVSEGVSLSDAMADFPKSFPNFVIAGIRSGEKSGRLDAVLENIALTIEKRNKFISSVSNAITYPLIVVFIASAVIIVLLTYVVPQIVGVFAQLDKALPPLTVGLIAFSGFVERNIFFILTAFLLLIIGIKLIKSNQITKRYWDFFWLKVPFFNQLIKEVEAIRFSQTMATLLQGGVVMVEAINHSLHSLNNSFYQQKMENAKQDIKEGKNLINAFEKVKLFDGISLQLINLGEVTGKIDQSLMEISTILEENFNQKITRYLTVFEPLLILVMGVIVLLIVLAILLPIFDLNQIVV